MSDIAIRVKNIAKTYQIYDRPQDRLKQSLWCGRKQFYREFSALHDISFEVKKGESVGIIGRNGSGKSTLLQIICGTLAPSSGTVEVNGRVGALLELGSGFNPEFSGRENVYMNASILGLSKKEIDDKYDEIVTFSEIADFIEQPVKTYSSGMMVRLAFAVQISVQPDILIVDEALSVGDFFFQQKCFAKIKELQATGTTLLFVSHDTGVVRDLCQNGLYLKNGEQVFWGGNLVAIRYYLSEGSENISSAATVSKGSNAKNTNNFDSSALLEGALWRNPNPSKQMNPKATILAVGVYDTSGEAVTAVEMGSEIVIRVMYQSFVDDRVDINVVLKNKHDQIVTAMGSYTLDIQPPVIQNGDVSVFELRMEMMLEGGQYGFNVNLGSAINQSNSGVSFHETPWLGPIQVVWDYENNTPRFYGMVGISGKASFISLSEEKGC